MTSTLKPAGSRRSWLAAALAAGGILATTALHAQTVLQKALHDEQVASHWIYDDFDQAVAQAKSTGKPLLALLRCVP